MERYRSSRLKFFDPRSINRSFEFSLINSHENHLVNFSKFLLQRQILARILLEGRKMEIFERAATKGTSIPSPSNSTCSHPRRRDQEGKRRRLGACIPVMQADIIPRPRDRSYKPFLPPPIAFADNTHHPTPPLPFSLLPRPFLSLSIEPSRRNDVIYPAYLMKPA